MATETIDQAKAEAFAGQMVGILNGSVLGLMTSIGHRTRLFDKMAELPPSTSEQIAAATSLNERYVREWLGAMVTGGFIEYDPAGKTYRLPPAHAACLSGTGATNMAPFSQLNTLLAAYVEPVAAAFREGGGVPYAAYCPAFP